MKYAVDYGLKAATTIVAEFGDREDLSDVSQKIEFVRKLSDKDEVYLEFGAGADKFALACLKSGARVFRIPTFVLKTQRENGAGDAELLLKLAQSKPELFYPALERDAGVLEIGLLLQRYYILQEELRKKAEQRLQLVYADELLVLGEPIANLEKALRKMIAKHPAFVGAYEEEKRLYREIDKAVRALPLYQAIFDPIKGVGGVIAGRIIYAISDIRRFPSPAHLKNYAGYGFTDSGEAQRRRKGEVANWNKFLKQGVFLFCDQVNRRTDCQPWNKMLQDRKAYERTRFPQVEKRRINGEEKKFFTNGHIHQKGMRYVGQKFLEHIWREWNKFIAAD